MKPWTPSQARGLYNMPNWGEGYFDVSDAGNVVVRPFRERSPGAVDLHELALRLPGEGLELPVLVRFTDILRDRVDALAGAFATVIGEYGYGGGYTGVYPIKVNQQGSVVEAILGHGGDRVGIEAGSKPELAAVLGLARPDSVIVCNGYKDRAYIRRALIGQKIGHRVYIVVEKLSELPLVIQESRALDVAPLVGLRVRLASHSDSSQQNTGGEKSKFGLATPQVLEAVEMMRRAGFLDAIRMVHFHLGSQVANVQDVARGMREAARFYVELRRLGAPVDVVDVGGGLGVDYEGTRSRSYCSMNYSVREYARSIVRTLQEVCAESGEPEPNLISESGRALTAHHAVLIANVVDQEIIDDGDVAAPAPEAHPVLHELHDLLAEVAERGPLESLFEARTLLAEAHAHYGEGKLSLAGRAAAERSHYAVARAVIPLLDPEVRAHRETLDELREKLSAKYFCNFSVFQSVPDSWAIDQVFPIMPIHRLTERPEQRTRLCDLTCDSDGRLDAYVDREGLTPTLALHPLRDGEPYLLGFFMVGAYQEILGDIHNLFGDTNAVNVVLDAAAPDGWRLEAHEHGDRTDELLRYVHLAPEELAKSYRRKLDRASGISSAQKVELLAELDAGLTGYTYLS
ncbi:MAG: biosynthetic arginine decarboxylase [Panacagrimonas sp.]|nr:biosynthetic arginine decarboxylase [Panacagrimonas sp.]MCC2656280.1 biosynthetic arginine decarboxylase [Panacagrimonas sp.]